MKRNISIFIIVIVLTGAAIYQNAFKPKAYEASEQQSAETGKVAPYFTLQGLDGQSYKVAGKREKPLLVHFWTSWCDSCVEEFPELIEWYDRYRDRVDVYAVNVTGIDRLKNVEVLAEQFQVPFPILIDMSNTVKEQYRISSVPTSFVVDRSGIILDKLHHLTVDQLELAFRDALN